MSASWLDEGVSTRTRFGHPSPVVHLVIVSSQELWCSGGQGRVAAVHSVPVRGYSAPRVCSACRRLAADAIAEGDLDAADVPRFVPRGKASR